MKRIRETYDLPDRAPVAFRQWALMLAIPALAIGLWIVLPDSPVVVAILVVAVLVAVFVGVQRVLASRQLSEPPTRRPTRPPSAGSGG
jgi:membrane protein implicated in regulation of membrane protease activity